MPRKCAKPWEGVQLDALSRNPTPFPFASAAVAFVGVLSKEEGVRSLK